MEAEKKAKGSEKVASEQTAAWHKPKNGSVFPAKRRSVKKMIWDLVVEFIADKAFKMVSNRNNSVHPCTSDPLAD